MPRLPNEILDKIWLERCKLGFEPRILQAKWIVLGGHRVPAFYGAQPQAFMTQLCRGAREVAAKGFYMRIFDSPRTGDGGFWWSEKDVLYVDEDFYDDLDLLGSVPITSRDRITRIAVDVQIDDRAELITLLLKRQFLHLSQTFFMCSASLPVSHYRNFKGRYCPRGSESASTKTLPIISFREMSRPRLTIAGSIFIHMQGLTAQLKARAAPEVARALLSDGSHVDNYIYTFVFERGGERQGAESIVSSDKDDGKWLAKTRRY